MQALIALEEHRCQALVSGDLAGIDAMLDPHLVYVHSTGLVNDKAALLDFLTHRIRYEAVERQGLAVHRSGDMAWMTGLMRLRGQRLPGGETVASTAFVSQLWIPLADTWRLHAFQATRVDDAMWRSETPILII